MAEGKDAEIVPTKEGTDDPCHNDVIKTDSKDKVGNSYTLRKCVTGNMYYCKDGSELSLVVEKCHDILSSAKEQYMNRLKVANSK